MMKSYLKPSVPMLSALVGAVLLSGCVSSSRYDYLDAQNKQIQQTLAVEVAQNEANTKAIAAQGAQINRLIGAIKYTINSDLMFPSGSWQMSAQGQQLIAKLASQLAPYQQSKIVVTGYTDNAPVGPTLQRQGIASNDVLSQKRAQAVMQYLISQGVKPELVSARGMGEAEPVATNDTPQGRAQNRRVEVSLAGPPS